MRGTFLRISDFVASVEADPSMSVGLRTLGHRERNEMLTQGLLFLTAGNNEAGNLMGKRLALADWRGEESQGSINIEFTIMKASDSGIAGMRRVGRWRRTVKRLANGYVSYQL